MPLPTSSLFSTQEPESLQTHVIDHHCSAPSPPILPVSWMVKPQRSDRGWQGPVWSQSTTPSASTTLHLPYAARVSLVPPLYLLFPQLESSFHRHLYAPSPYFLQVSAQCLFIREASPNHPVRSITFHFLSPLSCFSFLNNTTTTNNNIRTREHMHNLSLSLSPLTIIHAPWRQHFACFVLSCTTSS